MDMLACPAQTEDVPYPSAIAYKGAAASMTVPLPSFLPRPGRTRPEARTGRGQARSGALNP